MSATTATPPSADPLFADAYAELRRVAGRHLRGERRGHTLQPTALVHEAYLRLRARGEPWQDRGHFLALASRVMRQVLVDCARARRYQKRGGPNRQRITLQDELSASLPSAPEILDLDRALSRLAAFDRRKAQVVELRVFGGMTIAEVAAEIGTSKATVDREWRFARAWLGRALAATAEVETP